MGNTESTGDNKKGAHALQSPHPEQGKALHEAREGGHALKSQLYIVLIMGEKHPS